MTVLRPRTIAATLAAAFALAAIAVIGDTIIMGVRWALVATAILLVATAAAGIGLGDHPSHRSPATTPTRAAASGVTAAAPPRTRVRLPLDNLPGFEPDPLLVDVDTGEVVDPVVNLRQRVTSIDTRLDRIDRALEALARQADPA